MRGCFLDSTYVLMTVLLCKIQCHSYICFCKPSPHIYAASSLKLENTPHVEEDCAVDEKKDMEILKSSLKKKVLDSANGGRIEKKKVQWMDLIGKELAKIHEFESSEEEEDIRYDGDQDCVCVIM